MRFRANVEHVQTFQRIIQAIERLQKRCIVRFTETEMHIICNEETEDGVQVWSTIKVDSLFTDYRIQSNANNEINLSVSPEALSQALRSAASSTDVAMKLAKKYGHAVLAFEIVLALGNGGGLSTSGTRKASVAHDVLVEVLKPADMRKVKEPLCPEPDIHILLPPLQRLRTIVERMRAMADVLGVHANHRGGLRLSIESDQVRVQTQWSKCIIPNMASQPTDTQAQTQTRTQTQGQAHTELQSQTQSQTINAQDSSHSRDSPEKDSDEKDPSQWFGVHLSIRAFLKFLSSHVVSTTTIACICEDHCMILYVYIGDVQDAGGVLTFWIPARLGGIE